MTRPWTDHDGSGRPYGPDELVDVRFSDGRKEPRVKASYWNDGMWDWSWRNHSAHIVEHRRARG